MGIPAKIRDTTQILIDVYHVGGALYVHPLKALGRYSQHMFLPHRVSEDGWTPMFQSGEAAAVSSKAWKRTLPSAADSVAPWQSVYAKLAETAFCRYPGIPLGLNILHPNLGAAGHGEANLLVVQGLVAWMETHGDEIAGLDPSRPLLPQRDLLSDDQLRAVARSLDPLAGDDE